MPEVGPQPAGPTLRHVVRVADLSPEELERLLDLAARMKAAPGGWAGALPGRALMALFEKPSMRTRASLAVAAHRLGMLALTPRQDEWQPDRAEMMTDTVLVLSGYAAAIAVGGFTHATLNNLAAHAAVPVINARSDEHDPCQALADLLTVRERFGTLRGLKLAYVGDVNNVAHSLLEAGALSGLSVTVACPHGHEPADDVLDRAWRLQADHGGFLEVTYDPARAVSGAHVVYTDVWAAPDGDPEWRAALGGYRVTAALMATADARAIFLHPRPAHRGEEVDAAVIDGLRSAVGRQAANRLPGEQALMYALITGDWEGAR